jgi:ketosteroid isomerase-like protein
MSEENVEVVRRGYEAYERGDIPSWVDLFDPEVVFHGNADFPDSPTPRGHEGLRPRPHIRRSSDLADRHLDAPPIRPFSRCLRSALCLC